jgi:Domain of unknown function (DUF1833)
MPRRISPTLLRAIAAQESDEVLVVLLTLSHPSIDEPLRVCNDSQDVVSRGETFLSLPFIVTMPDDSPTSVPQVNITLDAIDRSFIQAIRSIDSAPSLLMELVLASDPDSVEMDWDFVLRNVEYDAFSITGTLSYEQILDEPYPGDEVTPSTLPGVFS